jgi:uroporphyrinogen decarboxylase
LLPSPEDAYLGEVPLLQEAIGDKGILLVSATQGVDQFMMDTLGVQNALLMYYDDRVLLTQLLRIFQEYHRAILKRVLEMGVEVAFEPWYNCSASVGWSPAQFREVFLPLIKENVELVHSYGAYVDYYDDGKMAAELEDLADAGVDIVETLAPPPLGDVALESALQRIGHRVCLKGHIDQVNLICFGKPEQVRQAVREALEAAKPVGGFILGTADSIRPESPPENVKAYFEAAYEFGKYE